MKRKRSEPVLSEHFEQVALFKRVRFYREFYPELEMVFAVPNGGHRNKAVAKKMKAEGVEPGIPDVFCDVARHGYHGLRIEMKRKRGGRLTTEQAAYIARYAERGYCAVVCQGCDAAWSMLCAYLGITNPEAGARSVPGFIGVRSEVMKWIPVKDQHPPFDEWVLVYCKIYGQYIGSYSRIVPDYDFGHWCDGKNYGVLPPTHWMHLPPTP